MEIACKRGGCHALPVATCFAQPGGWIYRVSGPNAARLTRKHHTLHDKHSAQLAHCAALAATVTRVDGLWQCKCNLKHSLSKIFKHKCRAAASRAGPIVRRHLPREAKVAQTRKRRRTASAFAAAASSDMPAPRRPRKTRRRPDVAGSVAAEAASHTERLARRYQLHQRALGAGFRRALSITCSSGRVPSMQRKARALQARSFALQKLKHAV
ncbi:unnamed protein product [Effrenium voratum]|nr:unnamed protein product [Effrenium voratum]